MADVSGDGTAVRGLGGERGYGEITLPPTDDEQSTVDVSAVFENGFRLGEQSFDASNFRVNPNGFVTFGSENYSFIPRDLQDDTLQPIIAAFWDDIYPRGDSAGTGNRVHVDLDTVADVVTITWDTVIAFNTSNEDQRNTFQIQLFDRGGGDFDIVFRYDNITWEGVRAIAGVNLGPDVLIDQIYAPADPLLTADTTLGNTGVHGLWTWSVGGDAIAGGAGADTLNGTADGERIFGLAGNDTILGLLGNDSIYGGSGTDSMEGGAGDDFYEVDESGDLVVEHAGEGHDQVLASVSYWLSDHVEDLTLRRAGIAGYGNSLDNVIQGSTGRNYLDGRHGADTLIGGAGNDVYFVRDTLETIVEAGFQGVDTVRTTVSFRLPAHVERLAMRSDRDLTGIGNAASNEMIGNSGDNRLIGRGGQDTLTGGAGSDRFIFYGNVDGLIADTVITDFATGEDTVLLQRLPMYDGLDLGQLNEDAFHRGATATTSAHRILFDAASGTVRYDADGVGGSSATTILSLLGRADLTSSDIFVF